MALRHVKATFECDGCGADFIIVMDNADKPELNETLFEVAVDRVRGGLCEDGFCSVQDDMHLCATCTQRVDEAYPKDDYTPSQDQIKEVLNNDHDDEENCDDGDDSTAYDDDEDHI